MKKYTKFEIECKHCGSTNLDLDHIFPSCRDCNHFLPTDVTRKSAAVAKSIEIETAIFKNTYGKRGDYPR